mmetsp:Transcript_20936/g.25396  ORF Transcript_20936/g.25396 Transcript_20936/m.25396 type:complete len:291 (+) Transcript_20936:246-1118(+)
MTTPIVDERQITSHILMIRPVQFNLNKETALDNYFQQNLSIPATAAEIQDKAAEEFDAFVSKLSEVGINVTVVSDTLEHNTPDSIFPNNWISLHGDGSCILYPMKCETRRKERKEAILMAIKEKGFHIHEEKRIDLTQHEHEGYYLEGTGSMVFDRINKIAYAAISERTHQKVLAVFSEKTGYQVVSFRANLTHKAEKYRYPIYHTNVMMCVGETFCVICLEMIDCEQERGNVRESLTKSGKDIIEISEAQVEQFAVIYYNCFPRQVGTNILRCRRQRTNRSTRHRKSGC